MKDQSALEKMFQNLMNNVYNEIEHKKNNGIISSEEADSLKEMVHDRTYFGEAGRHAWNSSGCAIASGLNDHFEDDSWDSSTKCW